MIPRLCKLNPRLIVVTIILGLSFLLAACDSHKPSFKGSDISGTKIGQDYVLTGTDGKTYTPKNFLGKVSLVFFGFTQCPDVCPTTLAELTEALKLLGDQANKVQIIMISVDPERDTPRVLSAYLAGFDSRILGLTGSLADIKRAAGDFKAYYAKVPQPNGGYNMDHSASFYMFDAKGDPRVLLANQAGAQAVAQDLKALLAQ